MKLMKPDAAPFPIPESAILRHVLCRAWNNALTEYVLWYKSACKWLKIIKVLYVPLLKHARCKVRSTYIPSRQPEGHV